MASDITITHLEAVGTVGQVALSALWVAPVGKSSLPYMQAANVEFWASATNNRSNAVKVKDAGPVGLAVHGGIADGATRYYWARAVDPAGNAGEFFPASSTGGVPATVTSFQPQLDALGQQFTTAINEEKQERISADGALASRTSVVEATLSNPSTGLTALSARITGEETARVTAVSALASRTSVVEATLSNPSTGLAATRAAVSSEQTARIAGDNTLAQNIQTVQTSIGGVTADGRLEMRAGPGGAYVQAFVSQTSGGAKTGSGWRINSNGDVDINADNFRIRDRFGTSRFVFDSNTGNLIIGRLQANSINTSNLFVDGVMVTNKLANNSVTDMVVQTGFGERGVLVSRSFTVTHGKVFLMGSTFLNKPNDNSANFGNIELALKYNGIAAKTTRIYYDDNFATGLTIVHEVTLSPSPTPYTFSFHADNLSGAGQWSMHGGSTLTIMNLKK
jgi:predicted phage tail protein